MKPKITHIYPVIILLGIVTVLWIATPHAVLAADGCCEKVDKETSYVTAEDSDEAHCEAIKGDYKKTTYFKDKKAFYNRCRSKSDIVDNSSLPKFTTPDIKVNIPGLISFKQPDFCDDTQTQACIGWIGQYIAALVNYLIGIVGVVGVVALMTGGIIWLTSAGNSQRVAEAKKVISGSLAGIVLALCSYSILALVNPHLLNLPPLKLDFIQRKGLAPLAVGDCNNGDCTKADEGITENNSSVPKGIIKAIVAGGEGCSQALSGDGRHACGFGQVLPEYRRKVCGLEGTDADCDLFKNDVVADINCAAKMLMEQAPRCGNFTDIRQTASCYNSGKANNCANTTSDYCGRVEDYLLNKCGTSTNAVTPDPVINSAGF